MSRYPTNGHVIDQMPEWMKHIRKTTPTSNATAWCGAQLGTFEWAFVDLRHAVASNQSGSGSEACPKCREAFMGYRQMSSRKRVAALVAGLRRLHGLDHPQALTGAEIFAVVHHTMALRGRRPPMPQKTRKRMRGRVGRAYMASMERWHNWVKGSTDRREKPLLSFLKERKSDLADARQ